MERENRNRRSYKDDRRNDPDNRQFEDESRYRGAYRLDNGTNHRNHTTYDGFDSINNRDSSDRNSRNNSYENGNEFSRDRYRNQSPENFSNNRSGYTNEYFGRSSGERQDHNRFNQGMTQADRYKSNFNNDYGPDNYRHNRGENYGNMAGSLSFGYDGDFNSDPDHDRQYDPLSGRRRSYQENYETRRNENQKRPGNRYEDRSGFDRDNDRF